MVHSFAGATGESGTTNLRIRGLLPRGYTAVRQHYTRLGALPYVEQGDKLKGGQTQPQVQRCRATVLQVQHNLHGHM